MNAQHERNLYLRTRLKSEGLLNDSVRAQLEAPWRTYGVPAQLAFFVLTCFAVGALYLLLKELNVSWEGLITGGVAIVVAEIFMARRWFFTGVEAGLWLSGMFSLISELPSSGTPESMLVLAASAAIPGFRVRSPLFGAVSAVFVMAYFEKRFDLGVICALVITLGACLALLRTWRRPTTEALWFGLALVMPIAGRVEAGLQWRNTTIALYALAGAVALALAIAKRHHALFLSAMISLAIAIVDLGERIAIPNEAKLAIAGTALLALAFGIARAIRNHTRGFVLTSAQITPFDDAAMMAATLTHQPTTPAVHGPPPSPGGGGSFGGAGASGDY